MSFLRSIYIMACIALGSYWIGNSLVRPDGLEKHRTLRKVVHEKEEYLSNLVLEVDALEKDIKAFKSRPNVQKRIIRDHLQLVNRGEIVLDLKSASLPQTTK
ncbi:MAG: hypothetical protein VYA34_09675 [Myxococcota bacterium]|nr:hypothetical protein [Myxococcota bacterium]